MKLPHKHSKGDSKLCPRIVQLNEEAESLTQAARYERSEARQGHRSGHYDRNLTTTSSDVTLHMPRLKGVSFETAIIERYRRGRVALCPNPRPKLWQKCSRRSTPRRARKRPARRRKPLLPSCAP